MIKIKIFPFNPFVQNTFVLSDETGECVVVDAGCYTPAEKKELENYIVSNNLKLVALINTHGHVDHVLGSRFVTERFGVKLLMHADEIDLLANAQKHGVAFGFNVEEPPVVTEYLTDNQEFAFGKSKLKVIHVPGHSRGSVAFYSEEQNFVIVGDVLFRGSIGRTDLPGGDLDVLMNSIMNKLMKLPEDTVVYPGHGDKTTLHDEALTNPFLGAE